MYSPNSSAVVQALVCCAVVLSVTQGVAGNMSCDWLTNPNQQLKSYISGSPTTITGVGNLTTCREQCMSQTTFICAAINYKPSTRNCQLLTENDKLATAEAAVGWVYSVRPICAGIWLPWNFVQKGVHTNGEGQQTQVEMTNLQSCMTSCLNNATGGKECRSITASLSGTKCDLSNVRVDVGDERIVNSSDWQYFSRPSWYLETSNASSTTEVKDYANTDDNNYIGYVLNIFLENKIPVSGYLVAWQYYLYYRSTRTMCSTFAGIWRKVGDTSYKLISRTLLTPEDNSVRGVRFQLIQNETIRLEKDDLVSVFSLNKETGDPPCISRVSGKDKYGDDAAVTSTTGSWPGDILKSYNILQRTTSLKAYLSEYLALKSAPQSHHNDSLRYGRVWLRLPPPLTTEDRVVVAGYRIICSTAKNLTTNVTCYDKLVPIGSRDVLLTLADVTRPHYAAVQIVRNFNGEELLENRYSPISTLFCADRETDRNVNLTEASIAEPDEVVNVTITILDPLTSDSCAKEIKVSYSDYDSGYMAIDRSVFTLRLDQRTTYDLKVYVKSEAGDEMILWRTTHSTTSIDTTSAASTTYGQAVQNSTPGIVGGVVAGLLVIILLVILAFIIYIRRSGGSSTLGKFFQLSRTNFGQSGSVKKGNHLDVVEAGVDRQEDARQNGYSRKKLQASLLVEPENKRGQPVALSVKQHTEPAAPIYENTTTKTALDELYGVIEREVARCPERPFEEEFLSLSVPQLPCLDGRIPENVKRNRFKNITAFDFNRVKLAVTDSHLLDYINASYIKDYYGDEKFIAAQGPNDHTLVDMWRMIDDTKAKVIVMVTNLVETGKRKCTQYWPDQVSTSVTYDDITVTLAEELRYASYIVRKLKYTLNNRRRTVSHFHYTEWYDKDVPSIAGLLRFRSRVKQAAAESNAPIIVHCSAGVGRTGTYIALDNLMEGALEKRYVDVFACVNKLRGQRMHMVQTHEQYACVYEMISEAVSCGTTAISCSEFVQQLQNWRKADDEYEQPAISEQFQKMANTSRPVPEKSFSIARSEENMGRNRDQGSLPTNRNRVIISQPEVDGTDYINASYCDSYQQKGGFIVTQTPLSTTMSDYWHMILEQKPAIIVYLNDCQKSQPYWPVDKDSSISAGQITVTNLKSKPLEGCAKATETVLECKSKEVHEVKLIEMKMEGNRLPTSQQLVSLCQQAEKYATTGSDSIVVQCRNGGRLSGIFVVAMNLYLRARIEQEIDVVLEVKLAREKRPQIVSDLMQFEALYDFVEYYLSEFNEYSNFADIRRSRP